MLLYSDRSAGCISKVIIKSLTPYDAITTRSVGHITAHNLCFSPATIWLHGTCVFTGFRDVFRTEKQASNRQRGYNESIPCTLMMSRTHLYYMYMHVSNYFLCAIADEAWMRFRFGSHIISTLIILFAFFAIYADTIHIVQYTAIVLS